MTGKVYIIDFYADYISLLNVHKRQNDAAIALSCSHPQTWNISCMKQNSSVPMQASRSSSSLLFSMSRQFNRITPELTYREQLENREAAASTEEEQERRRWTEEQTTLRRY